MGLTLRWVRYGRPAAEELRALIAEAKGHEPLAPVTVVVPSNYVGVAARRLLASGALGPACARGVGLAAVTFVTPYRLAELLGAPVLAAAGRRPVSTPVIAAALRASLAERPGVFAPVAAHPATEAALVEAYRELRDLSDAALDAVAATGARAGEVVRLGRATRARLEPQWYDEEDLMAAAVDALGTGAGVATQLGRLVVHLPQRLSRHAVALLAAAGDRADVTVVAGATGVPAADAEVADSLARLGARGGPSPDAGGTAAVVAPGRTRMVTASDADDEVRAAVRAVVDAVRSGTPLDRVAVLYAGSEPYARLVHEHLSAAGIPANGAAVVPAAGRMAGRALVGVLALPEGGFRRQDVFAWLASAPVLHDGRWAPVTAWERVSRRAAVVAGRVDWDDRLVAFASDLEADAMEAEADPDAPARRSEASRSEAARARALRTFVLDLVDDLAEAAARPRRWSHHARWASRLLRQTLGGEGRRAAWPAADRKAAERVELALQRLAALDAVEGPVDLAVFTRTLELELEADLGRVGRFGEGVLVGSVAMGTGLDLDLVVVVGMAEGALPAAMGDDSLLPDHERRVAGGELPLRSRGVERQHRQLLAALAGAASHVLGVPRGDLRRSSEHVASRWALDVASVLAGRRVWSAELLGAQTEWVDHVASFDAGIRRLSSPATAQEHRLRSLVAGASLTEVADPVLTGGSEAVAARRSGRFTRFDGNLAGLPIPSPVDAVVSPTRLERWAACPFSYLVENVLRAEAVDNPEEQLTMSPVDWGFLVHEALDRFVAEVLRRPPGEQPSPDQPWTLAERARLAAIGEELWARYRERGLAGRPIFWRRDRDRLLADLARFLDADDEHRRRHSARPLAAELVFGLPGSGVDAVPIPLPDGRVLRFQGRADRLDLAADGTFHVVDYKTGRSRDFDRLCEEDPDLRGTKLQLAVYGVAGRILGGDPGAPVRAEYFFVSAKGEFKRVGYAVGPEVLDRVSRTLGTMVAGIEAGIFPARPSATSTSRWVECHPCDPDGLGVTELRARWERKRLDPAVVLYADLAEPLKEVAVEVEEVASA